MADEDKNRDVPEGVTTSAEDAFRAGRRQALKIGAVLVPTIITLQATPAWAQTDYTMVAYRYGANAGLCRNPKFNPNASSNSPNSEEFIPCPPDKGKSHIIWEPENQTGTGGTTIPDSSSPNSTPNVN